MPKKEIIKYTFNACLPKKSIPNIIINKQSNNINKNGTKPIKPKCKSK